MIYGKEQGNEDSRIGLYDVLGQELIGFMHRSRSIEFIRYINCSKWQRVNRDREADAGADADADAVSN